MSTKFVTNPHTEGRWFPVSFISPICHPERSACPPRRVEGRISAILRHQVPQNDTMKRDPVPQKAAAANKSSTAQFHHNACPILHPQALEYRGIVKKDVFLMYRAGPIVTDHNGTK
jgi:hypothetical protein